MGYSIKVISEQFGLSSYTLRYYEKEGLLPFIARDEHGNRCFRDEDLDLLHLVCCLKDTGMPIANIRQFVDLTLAGSHTLGDRRLLLEEHKKRIDEQVSFYQQFSQKINDKIVHFAAMEEES